MTQLLADRLELLVEIELLLVLVDLTPDLALDLSFEFQDLELVRERLAELPEPLREVVLLQHGLLHRDFQNQVRGDRVGEEHRISDVVGGREHLVRHAPVQVHVVVEGGEHVPHHRLELRVLAHLVVDDGDGGRHVVRAAEELLGAGAADPLDQHAHRAVREAEELQDADHGSDPVEILRGRVRYVGPALRQHEEHAVLLHGRFDRVHGRNAPHEERNRHIGENHHIAKREKRDPVPDLEDLAVALESDHVEPTFFVMPLCGGDRRGRSGSVRICG